MPEGIPVFLGYNISENRYKQEHLINNLPWKPDY
jgi:hypothetical protein